MSETEGIEDSYPLSPMQQGMLFHTLYAPGSGVDIEQIVCALPEALDISAFTQSWQRVIERHPALRTSFRWEGLDQPIQEVQRHLICPLEQQDWRGLAETEQKNRLDLFLRTDRQRGFVLNEAPLMRLSLFRWAEADYRFVWTFHHILLDGRSFPLIFKELFAFYEAFRQGQDLHLASPRPYRDYIAWLEQQDFSKTKTFWQQLLQGFTTPTPLIGSRSAISLPEGEHEYGVQEIRLSETLTTALQSLAERHQLTLNTLVQGAWALLLGRYSGQADVIFGATRACRRSALAGRGPETMVGVFMNTLPVRVRIPPDMKVLAWLKELRAQSIALREEAREHTPLVKIQEWSDLPGGMPLFETILVFENYRLNTVLQAQGGNWQNREFRVLAQTNYPLTFVCRDVKRRLLRLIYDRRRFAATTIHHMLGHLQTLLQDFVTTRAAQRLSEVSLLTEAERHQILVEWNETHTDKPAGGEQCLHHLFEAQVERTPEATALVFQGERWTYRELNRRANQLAHYLQTLGVGPEGLVGICMTRCPQMMVGLLGILKAGGAYLPLDPTDPEERLAFIMEDARISVLVSQKRLLRQSGLDQTLAKQARHIIYLDVDDFPVVGGETGQSPTENLASGVKADNLAYVIYTSGSTGKPKGAMIPHRGLVNYLRWCTRAYAVEAGRGAPVHASIGFDMTVTSLFAPLLVGRSVVLLPEDQTGEALLMAFSAKTSPDKEAAFSLVKLTPAHLELLSQQLPPEAVAGQAKWLIIGGEALRGELLTFWQRHAPDTRLVNEYGPTETVVGCCVYEVPAGTTISGAVPIGRPIANTQLYLLDRYLQPVPVGVPGELYIGGAGLARGYLNRPDLTAEKFIPNPFSQEPGARLYKSGDLVRYLPDGTIEFLGRIDHQVKIRGFRIELGEIETVLGQHPAVRETVLLAREDGPGQKRLVAYVVPNQAQQPKISDLRGFLQTKLPDYMLPSAFVLLEAIPLTANGKVDRRALPAPDTTRPELAETYVPPRNPVEAVLSDIWIEVLGLERVGVYDNFFELGGHSLLATRLISRVHKTFQTDMPLRSLFEAPTIAGLAERLIQHEVTPGRVMAIARLRQKIGQMSADELQALLQEKRQRKLREDNAL